MRSMLFVPADSERKLARGLESGADALILDLEDSVAAANRPIARRLAREFLEAHSPDSILRYVRINPLASGVALDDLAATIARRSGFAAKMAIHPAQLATINEAFSVSAAEREWAERVLAAFAANPGAGTLALDGKMIDKPHMTLARRLLGLPPT